jgi:hypothetical protein
MLLNTMGVATIVSIQLGLMHLSPKIFSPDVSILNNAGWISKMSILILNKILHLRAVDFFVVPGGTHKYVTEHGPYPAPTPSFAVLVVCSPLLWPGLWTTARVVVSHTSSVCSAEP